ISLLLAFEFKLHIGRQRIGSSICVNHDRVVDNEIDGYERVDLLRIAAGAMNGVTHGSQVDDNRNTGEVLQHDARRNEWNLLVGVLIRCPASYLLDMLLSNRASIELTDRCFEQHANRDRQLAKAGESLLKISQ